MGTRIALCDVRGPLNDLIQKLSGDDGHAWLQGLTKFLRKEHPWGGAHLAKGRWRIEFEVDASPLKYYEQLLLTNVKLSQWVSDDLLEKMTLLRKSCVEFFVDVSAAELGFPNGAPYGHICRTAVEYFGLGMCPQETGPALRLKYKNQPRGEYLTIAAQQICDATGDDVLFVLTHEHYGLGLEERTLDDFEMCGPNERFVFSIPFKPK